MARNLSFIERERERDRHRERERERETEIQREGGVRFRKKSSTQCWLAGWLVFMERD
jgi:hypothetical protein